MNEVITQNRFKSILTWTAIIAQVSSIALLSGVLTPEEIDTGARIAGIVLEILVTVGILNNPTAKNKF